MRQRRKPAGTQWYLPVLVGLAGFEPTHAGVKVPCLTAWRQPSKNAARKRRDDIEKSELFRIRFFSGVASGIRTHGLQSHNLAR